MFGVEAWIITFGAALPPSPFVFMAQVTRFSDISVTSCATAIRINSDGSWLG